MSRANLSLIQSFRESWLSAGRRGCSLVGQLALLKEPVNAASRRGDVAKDQAHADTRPCMLLVPLCQSVRSSRCCPLPLVHPRQRTRSERRLHSTPFAVAKLRMFSKPRDAKNSRSGRGTTSGRLVENAKGARRRGLAVRQVDADCRNRRRAQRKPVERGWDEVVAGDELDLAADKASPHSVPTSARTHNRSRRGSACGEADFRDRQA